MAGKECCAQKSARIASATKMRDKAPAAKKPDLLWAKPPVRVCQRCQVQSDEETACQVWLDVCVACGKVKHKDLLAVSSSDWPGMFGKPEPLAGPPAISGCFADRAVCVAVVAACSCMLLQTCAYHPFRVSFGLSTSQRGSNLQDIATPMMMMTTTTTMIGSLQHSAPRASAFPLCDAGQSVPAGGTSPVS